MMNKLKRTWSFIILLFASSFLIPLSSCGSKEGTAQSAEEVEEAGTATEVDGTEHPEGEKSEHPKAESAEHPKAEENEHPTSEGEHPKKNDE